MPARWRSYGVAAVLALLACGCAGASSDGGTEAVEPPCRPDHRAPITERELKAALDAEGIRLLRDSDCSGEELGLSNITDAVSSEQVDVILASEGHVFCDLYTKDTFSPRIERFVWRNDPDPTYLDVLNVSCAIYPETREQTDVLEHALRRLPGVSELPSTLPSDDAVRD
jgi:hypothetical protein